MLRKNARLSPATRRERAHTCVRAKTYPVKHRPGNQHISLESSANRLTLSMSLQFGQVKLPAPAKLNLMLHVTGRRADGYHNLQTLFHFLDYCDELTFSSRDDGEIVLRPSLEGVDDSHNLIYRAAKLLQRESSTTLGADIDVTKRIPMGGGLGGGSSDAATTLIGLNKLWRTGLAKDRLQSLSLTLGADVPIFVFGRSSWAEGVGDILTPVEIPEQWYVVIAPSCHVSTALVFSHADLDRNTPATTLESALKHGGLNDCQSLVVKLYPEVLKCLQWLEQHGKAQMTGTGSCVFAAFPTHEKAQEVFAQLPEGMDGFVSRGLNLSPVYQTGIVSFN
ncbi:uncharacterized protein LOC110976096 [Acanthaster planci]|uniref:4-(cytidine 5'-diphospho)-2-C-methyl-D-erythritol kinase n=1 Tax=Acanthaster planci TaxID=133434 RepID=A0A8B7XV90_ACAPL|nr:uncharacterized protein LOC110976096 [Acanthaster planci]